MIQKLLVVFLLLILTHIDASLNAQQVSDRIVGKTGDRIITEDDYLERYEFTPWFRREHTGFTESTKLEFLYTLFAEKLWAMEASRSGLDTIEVMKFSKKAFEKMFVRDELYRREMINKIDISEDEIIDAYFKSITTLYVNYLISEDEEEINHLYNLLNVGIPFDSILAESPEFAEQIAPVKVVFGQMEEFIEDSLYSLNAGDYTSPIYTPDGWYIFYLRNRWQQMIPTEEELMESAKSIEKIIKARREKELYWEFKHKFFTEKNVNINPVLFESLARRLSRVLRDKQNVQKIRAGDPVHMLADEVLIIENEFGADSLKMNYIPFDTNPVSLKKFLRTLAFDGFSTTDCSLNYMRGLLDSQTKQFVERELLYREGIKRGIHLLPEVQRQINTWTDNYLFQVLREKFLDSAYVSDQEVMTYYSAIHKEESYPALIRISQIITDSLEVMDWVVDELNEGKYFSEVVDMLAPASNPGVRLIETELLPYFSLGTIGDIAASMEVNEVYGPMEFSGQYLIFELLEKNESKTVPPEPFEKVGESLRRELLQRKIKLKMDNYTTNLAIKYGLTIDFDVLDSIEVTNYSSFGIRYLGFGGKMTAVPLVAPNFEWVIKYLEKINQIQP